MWSFGFSVEQTTARGRFAPKADVQVVLADDRKRPFVEIEAWFAFSFPVRIACSLNQLKTERPKLPDKLNQEP